MRRLWAALLAAILGAGACTQDFDSFSVGEGGAAGAAAAAAAGGTGGAAGFGGRDGGGGDATAGAAGQPVDASDAADVIEPDGSGCEANEKRCGAICVSLTDPRYGCGGASCTPCDTTHATATCDTAGACAIERCDTGFDNCDGDPATGCEADLSNPSTCGDCGTICSVVNGTAGCDGTNCTVQACNTGFQDCDGKAATGCERNTDGDPTACGSCSNDCTAQAGEWDCVAGQCVASQCPAGTRDCDNNPSDCETNVNTSLLHCGFCNNPCTLPNAQSQCNGGSCEIVQCDTGWGNCDGDAANGCEAQLSTNADHCGACDRPCSSTGVQTRTCAAGVCTSSCNVGSGNCSQPAAPAADDGCETNLQGDPTHCGACNRACSSTNATTLSCSGGVCDSACTQSFGNCTKPTAPFPDDGCETDVDANTAHCGACNRACSTISVLNLACSGGVCTSSCLAGTNNCSQPAAPDFDDGCETSTSTDPNNCGACGRVCSSTGATNRRCVASKCAPTCDAGFADCVLDTGSGQDDGCTDLNTNPYHCGLCDAACSTNNVAALSCTGGTCTPACEAGWGDCDKTTNNGCETDLEISGAHCGSCNNPCGSNESCIGGQCIVTSCSAGYSDCDGDLGQPGTNGCEVNTDADPLNCGACGRVCSGSNVASLECSSGVCTPTCQLGWDSCLEPAAPNADDGCERDVRNDNGNCGSCGNDCSGNLVCGDRSPNNICGCNNEDQCGPYSVRGSCTSGGLCGCNRGITNPDQICQPGERCVDDGFNRGRCACNGGNACSSGQVCCQSPAGCRNLQTSTNSCGACGRQCPAGFVCASGSCACDADEDCNAGSAGTCGGNGRCSCTGGNCPTGKRCLADGNCG